MKQVNLEQKVFAELLLEQSQKEIEVDIVVKQIIAGKSADIVIKTTNTLTVPVFSTSGEGWVYVPEELIDDVSASVTGSGEVWLDGDQIKCSGAQPTPAHSFDKKSGKWVLDTAKQAELDTQAAQAAFEQAKAAKTSEINVQAQAYIDHATGADQLPAFEVQSWAIQGAEAKAWHADSTAPTPTLDAIAKARCVPLDALRAGAYKKTMMYEAVVASVTGQRQKYNDQLRAAKTLTEIDAINVVYG